MSTKFDFRWGLPELDDEGYVHVYGFMLRNYAHAGVTRDEFLCIVHLAAYHYNSIKGQSRPSLATIAAQMGYGHENSVRRLVQSLERKGMLAVTRRDGKPSVYDASGFAKKMLVLQQATCVDGMVTKRKRVTPTRQCTPSMPASTPTSEGVPPLPSSVGEEAEPPTQKKAVEAGQAKAIQPSSTTTAAAATSSPTPRPPHFEESLSLLKRIGVGEPKASLIAAKHHATPAFIEAHARAWEEQREVRLTPPSIRILIVRLEEGERVAPSERPPEKELAAREKIRARQLSTAGYRRPS